MQRNGRFVSLRSGIRQLATFNNALMRVMDTAIGGAVSEIVGDTVGAAVGDYGSCRSPTAAGSVGGVAVGDVVGVVNYR